MHRWGTVNTFRLDEGSHIVDSKVLTFTSQIAEENKRKKRHQQTSRHRRVTGQRVGPVQEWSPVLSHKRPSPRGLTATTSVSLHRTHQEPKCIWKTNTKEDGDLPLYLTGARERVYEVTTKKKKKEYQETKKSLLFWLAVRLKSSFMLILYLPM